MEDSNQEMQLPTGFRFLPTDEELVFYYLHRKLTGESLPPGLIGEFNLYSDKNPWEILDKNYTGYFHVFTELRYLSKQKVGRRAGCGTWKGENTKNICDEHGNILWFKKAFVFEIDQNKIQTTTDVEDSGHWLMTEFSLPGAQNYVVCKIYNKEAVEETTKPMQSKKRKLPTNTNLAGVGSSKKKKKEVPNSEYGTLVVPAVPQDQNDLALTVVPEQELEPEIQNNILCSDYYQQRLLPHNNTAVETYMEEVIPSYGTSDVSIPIPEVQMDPEPEVDQQSDEDDFNEILFLLEDVNNNIDVVPIQVTEDQNDPEPRHLAVEQSIEDEDDPQQLLFAENFDIACTENNIEEITSPEYRTPLVPQNEDYLTVTQVPEPEQQSIEDDHTIIPICDFKFGDKDDDQTTLLPDNFQHLMESDDINFDQFPSPALNHEYQTSTVPELPLDQFHFQPPEYDCLTSLHCY